MSYILDALKKAETERNLGAVPTIHAQPAFRVPSATSAPVWHQPWIWTIFLVLGVIAAVLGWIKPWQAAPVVATVASAQSVAVPKALPEQVPDNTAKVAPQTPTEQTAPPAAPVASPTSEPAMSASSPALAAPSVAQAAPLKPVQSKPKSEPARANSTHATSPAHKKPESVHTTTTQSEEPVPTLRELPEQLQREIPPVAIGGYIYSANRADRSILIDKKLLREGDQVSPNLTLEKMLPNGVIFNYKGYRYRTSY